MLLECGLISLISGFFIGILLIISIEKNETKNQKHTTQHSKK